MKKIYLSIFSIVAMAFGANAQLPWTEDFNGGTGQFTVTNSGTGTSANLGWAHETNPGAIPVGSLSPFASTTASNGFMFVSSDAAGGADNDGNQIITEMTSSVIDCSTTPNVVLKFQHNYRWWHDSRIVEVSGDNGATWTTYQITDENGYDLGYSSGDQNSLNPQMEVIDITAVAGGQSQVLIKFKYDDHDWWAWYWAIDDISVELKPDDDLQMLSSWVTGENNEGLEYGRTPMNHLETNYIYGSEVFNFGVNNQTNVTVDIDYTDAANPTQFSLTATMAQIDSDSTELVQTAPTAQSFAKGIYKGVYTVTSDNETSASSTFGDNTMNRYFEVTDSLYSLDGIGVTPSNELLLDQIGTGMFMGGDDGFMVATMYHIKTTDTIGGLVVALASTSQPGGQIMPMIMDTATVNAGNTTPTFIGDPVDVTQADINAGFIYVPFATTANPTNYAILQPGAYYAVVELTSNGGTNNVRILDDKTVPQPAGASLIYLAGDQWYTNGVASGVRLVTWVDPTLGVEETTLEGVSVYPNPSNGIITISNENNTANNIVVTDVTGKVVYTTSANTTATIDLSSNGTGIYLVKISNENGSVVERIVIK